MNGKEKTHKGAFESGKIGDLFIPISKEMIGWRKFGKYKEV